MSCLGFDTALDTILPYNIFTLKWFAFKKTSTDNILKNLASECASECEVNVKTLINSCIMK